MRSREPGTPEREPEPVPPGTECAEIGQAGQDHKPRIDVTAEEFDTQRARSHGGASPSRLAGGTGSS
jgi:hypothetical protein